MSVKKPFIKKIESLDHIDVLISKGASVKEDAIVLKEEWSFLNLRIPTKMLNNVNEAVSHRIGITRTGWILEAIHEKLKKEREAEKT